MKNSLYNLDLQKVQIAFDKYSFCPKNWKDNWNTVLIETFGFIPKVTECREILTKYMIGTSKSAIKSYSADGIKFCLLSSLFGSHGLVNFKSLISIQRF